MRQIKKLNCAICGQQTYGRQWHAQDTGWGICNDCAYECKKNLNYSMKFDSMEEFLPFFESCFGKEGIHWNIIKKPSDLFF